MALIFIAGAMLRLHALDFQPLWLDELFSRADGLSQNLAGVIASAARDVHPPGYPLLVYLTVHCLNANEAALRLPSALAGIASLGVVFALGRRLFSVRVGLTAAALLATHWYAVYYSQEGRPYSLLLLCATLMAYFALDVLGVPPRDTTEHSGERKAVQGGLLGLFVTGLISSYLHYFGLLYFLCLGGFLFVVCLRRRLQVRRLFWVYAAAAVCYAPWIAVMMTQAQTHPHSVTFTPSAVARTYNDTFARHPLWFLIVAMLAAVARWRSGNGLTSAESERRPRARLMALCLWAILPVLGGLAVTLLVTPVYRPRNLIGILPAIILLSAFGLERIDLRWFRGLPVASCLFALALFVDLVWLKEYYVLSTKEPLRQLTLQVISASKENPDIAVWAQPTSYTSSVNQYLDILHASFRATRPGAGGQPVGQPEVLWIIARGRPPAPPKGYTQVEFQYHPPSQRIPWPGRELTLARYVRAKN